MRGRRSSLKIQMDANARAILQTALRRQKTPVGLARRVRAMLLLEQGCTYLQTASQVGLAECHIRKWAKRFLEQGVAGLSEKPRPGRAPTFLPEVALQIVKLACEHPDHLGCSLSQWDCAELARKLQADGIVSSISPATVRRVLQAHQLKPWRSHLWLSPKVPRNQQFVEQIRTVADLYTRPLTEEEMVLSLDEKTNLQPRSRLAPTLPSRPGQPLRLEHEYKRAGALHLFAAFDTRTGKVYARTELRKRQVEFITFLSQLEQELPVTKIRIYLVMDNLKVHKGKLVQIWLEEHPRFQCHFTPVHCSWMNQIEQWFSILQRKRLSISDFSSREQLADRLMTFVHEWNAHAHPFHWSTKSIAKVMAKCDVQAVHIPVA
jgi:transposase